MKLSQITFSVAVASVTTFAVFEAPAKAASLDKFEILTLGDSLTSGVHSVEPYPGAYRIQLQERLNSKFENIDFVGTQQNGPATETGFDQDHAGYGGFVIKNLREVSELQTKNDSLDMVLLMAGTNDINSKEQAGNTKNQLVKLVEAVKANFANAQLFVSSLPPFDTEGTKFNKDTEETAANKAREISEFNTLISKEKFASDNGITYVNAGGSLDTSDLVRDGLHPSEDGYQEIGNAWFEAIQSFIPDTYLIQETGGEGGGEVPTTGGSSGEGDAGEVPTTGGSSGEGGGEVPTAGGNGSSPDTTVPEPTSLVGLLAAGVFGAGATRKRKQKLVRAESAS